MSPFILVIADAVYVHKVNGAIPSKVRGWAFLLLQKI